MTKKIRLIRTMVTEYVPNPECYDKGMTIEEMAQSDAEQDDLETIFSEIEKDEVKWEIINGDSTCFVKDVSEAEAVEVINVIPTILEEQEVVVAWARKKKEDYWSVSSIITALVSEKPSKTLKKDEEYMRAREVYRGKNSGWQDSVLLAIQMDIYRMENDIRPGQLVTNGCAVGFAGEFDFTERRFHLFASKDESIKIGKYLMDDFQSVK
ncbi:MULTISPECIES: hypothetical protein [unclassified Bacillus cereus group]|uniref:hypothetical protein n=1 Tax=unclassified Bacillus cereus group TaxID=2750818 RepID=UPI001F57AD70